MVDIKKSVVSGEDVTIRVAGHVALHGDSNTERTGIGTMAPARTLHLRSGDAVPLRIESTSAASPGIEVIGSGGSGTLSYNSATGQWVLGTDLESTDTNLAVDVLSVPDGGASAARIEVGTGGDLKVYHDGTNTYAAFSSGKLILYGGSSSGDVEIWAANTKIAEFDSVTKSTILSKGLTVNTTAASSALVVDDGTGIVSCGPSGGGSRELRVNSPTGGLYGAILTDASNAIFRAANGTLQLETIGANQMLIQTNNITAVTINGSTQVASFAKGLVVPVVADATAESALTATAGALCFRTDTSKHRGYNGSAWVDLY